MLYERTFDFDPPMLHHSRPWDGLFYGGSHPFGVSLKGLAALRAASRSPYAPLRKPRKYAVFCFPNMITRVSYEGEIVFDNYLRIDNSDNSPDEAAKMIKETFHL